MRTRRLLPVFVIACALVAGALPRAQAPAQKPSVPGYPAIGSPAVVKLLAPGAAPLKAIRYVVPATYKARMDLTTGMEMTMSIPMPTSPFTISMGISLAVTSVAPNGDVTYGIEFTKAEVGPTDNPVAGAMQAGMGSVVGLKGTATVSNRGVTKSVQLDLDKIGDPTVRQGLGQMTQAVENLLIPFPEEPLGVGARWEVRQAIMADAVATFTRAEYELVSIDGSTVNLRAKTEESAPTQKITNPAMPGMEIDLEKLSGAGTGTATVQLGSLVPTREMQNATSTTMGLNMGGAPMSITVDVKLKISIAPGK